MDRIRNPALMVLKLFKSHLRAHLTFQKPMESPFPFSRIWSEFQYIHHPIGKKEFKSYERIENKFDQ